MTAGPTASRTSCRLGDLDEFHLPELEAGTVRVACCRREPAPFLDACRNSTRARRAFWYAGSRLMCRAVAAAATPPRSVVPGRHPARRHRVDPIGQQDRFVHVVRDQHHRRSALAPDPQEPSCNVARVSASRALNGSSINRSFGCMARPRATATRWRIPPESSRGRFQAAGVRLTRAMNSSVIRRRSAADRSGFTASTASATLSRTLSHGRSE